MDTSELLQGKGQVWPHRGAWHLPRGETFQASLTTAALVLRHCLHCSSAGAILHVSSCHVVWLLSTKPCLELHVMACSIETQ